MDGHYVFSIVPSTEHATWIIDSGATTHVCYDREMLHTIYRLERPVTIHLPDGSLRQVTVGGKVQLNKDIILEDVLFVPGFTHNLLSVAQLIHDSGVRCTFYPTHCTFQRGHNDQIIGMGKMENNLYVLETVVENHFTHLFRAEDMTL